MNKEKNKSLIKTARKSTRKELEVNITAHLKEVVGSLGHESKKTTKEIEKASKRLAKRLAEMVRIDKAVAKEVKQAETASIPQKETLAHSENHSDFSSPQPLPAQEAKQESAISEMNKQVPSKKPVISSSASKEESTVELAERITNSPESQK